MGIRSLEGGEILLRRILHEILIYTVIIIFSVIVASAATVVYYYIKLPNQAIYTVPGKMFSATELVEHLDETSLYGLSVTQMATQEKKDFFKYMWDEKKLYLNYSYNVFTTTEEVIEGYQKSSEISLEYERKAIDSIVDYAFDEYENIPGEAANLLDPLTWYTDYQGDSSTLLIMISLIGMRENKHWFNSDTKIAITASMDQAGNVLPVGSVRLKTITAKSDHADVLIVPKSQLSETKIFPSYFWRPMTIVGVETIDEAIEWLDKNIQ